MAAVVAKRVPVRELSADLVRQLRNLNDEAITVQITDLWGTVARFGRRQKADDGRL